MYRRLLALDTVLFTCAFHVRSAEMVTPSIFALSVLSICSPFMVMDGWSTPPKQMGSIRFVFLGGTRELSVIAYQWISIDVLSS